MRNLVIKRNKSFVGFISKLKVYIEDYVSGDTTINGVPCRKLGTIKNGEEKAFVIDDNSRKVFVIADKLSKGFCNEFYNIPEGQADVFLSGQCRYNPAAGNAFRFDGVTDEAVLQNRKKGTKIGIIVLIIAAIVGFAIGFFGISDFLNMGAKPKQFTCEEMRITLTSDFMKVPMETFDACFATEDVVVFALREDFNLLDGLEDYSIKQYGELVLEANGLKGIAELSEFNGITYYEYEAENTEENEIYYYYATVFKSDDAFWTVQFAVLTEDADRYLPQLVEWSETITFTE